MQSSVLQGILLPFWGTSLGAACVFCLRRAPSAVLRRVLEGFAAGVMTAASVWSLLLPAIDWADMGRWSFLPAAGGFWLGVLFLRLLERLLPEAVTDRSTTMTLLAVTLHNIPEGMTGFILHIGRMIRFLSTRFSQRITSMTSKNGTASRH